MSYETNTATAKANPLEQFIAKPDTTSNLDIDIAMVIAVGVVYLLVGLDLLEHVNVCVQFVDLIGLFWQQGYFIEGLLHFIMLAM